MSSETRYVGPRWADAKGPGHTRPANKYQPRGHQPSSLPTLPLGSLTALPAQIGPRGLLGHHFSRGLSKVELLELPRNLGTVRPEPAACITRARGEVNTDVKPPRPPPAGSPLCAHSPCRILGCGALAQAGLPSAGLLGVGGEGAAGAVGGPGPATWREESWTWVGLVETPALGSRPGWGYRVSDTK